MSTSEQRKRNSVLQSRCDQTEEAVIRRRATAAGYKHVGTFMRDAALGVERAINVPEEAPPKTDVSGTLVMTPVEQQLRQLRAENGRTGANLNQMVAHINRIREELRSAAINKLTNRFLEILELVRTNQTDIRQFLRVFSATPANENDIRHRSR